MSYLEQFQRLVARSNALPAGRICVELMEQAVRIADVHLSIQHRFSGRSELIRACFRSGIPLPMMSALTWCLGAIDRGEIGRFQREFGVALWQCKHAVTWLPNFSSVSYEQFNSLLTDVLKRYEAAAASPRAVYQIAAGSELSMGHSERAVELSDLGRRCPRDLFSESAAWELYFDVEFLFYFKRNDEGLQRLEPVWKNPSSADGVFNHFVSTALFPLLDANRKADALRLCHQMVPGVVRNLRYLDAVSTAIAFYSCTSQTSRAVRIVDKTLVAGLAAHCEADQVFYSHALMLLMQRLQSDGRSEINFQLSSDSLKNELPDSVPISNSGEADVVELAAWLFDFYTPELEKFNKRNGNTYMTSLLDERSTHMS